MPAEQSRLFATHLQQCHGKPETPTDGLHVVMIPYVSHILSQQISSKSPKFSAPAMLSQVTQVAGSSLENTPHTRSPEQDPGKSCSLTSRQQGVPSLPHSCMPPVGIELDASRTDNKLKSSVELFRGEALSFLPSARVLLKDLKQIPLFCFRAIRKSL